MSARLLARLLASLLAGCALAAAFEPVRFLPGLVLGFAVLLLCLPQTGWRSSAGVGLAFGAGFMFVHLAWLRAVGVDAWLALAGAQSLYFAVLAVVLIRVRDLAWWPWWSAVLWVGFETVRGSFPFGGLPWGRLAYGTVDSIWAAGLPWVGMTGVSLLLALTGSALAWCALRVRAQGRPTLRVAAVLGGVAALTAAPALIGWDPGPAVREVTIATVQGDVPGDGSDILLDHRQVTRNHVEATVALGDDIDSGRVARPDLVLWPENSTAVDPFADAEIGAGIREAVAAVDVPVLVGAIVDGPEPGGVLNQGIVWDPETGAGDRYTKKHPVPFGEYIPYRDQVFTRNFGRLSLIGRDMLSGTRIAPLEVDGIPVAGAICYDVAYDDGIGAQMRAGAGLLVVQTSNAMFVHTHQLGQQFAITRLRALETGRAVAVASTNGVSGIIAADGEVIARSPIRARSVLVADVAVNERRTPAVLLGEWPSRVLFLLSGGVILFAALPYRRRQQLSGGHRLGN